MCVCVGGGGAGGRSARSHSLRQASAKLPVTGHHRQRPGRPRALDRTNRKDSRPEWPRDKYDECATRESNRRRIETQRERTGRLKLSAVESDSNRKRALYAKHGFLFIFCGRITDRNINLT